ncbi:anti-sigma factor [Terracidiphilus gabretensis]|jgi:hypothetical protein|uniref:hypothetical protein n=1 Tax=Terracidiphilus gabretensis TaxID=1577687 RepID=UPI00071BFC58|nr:hypothetical protein [Terracidiphilus gabretensis]
MSEFKVPEKMTCEEFQSHLPDLIATGEDIFQHPHILECELCRSLLADLEAIADAARQLLAPAEDPPDTVWEQIQSKIQAEGPGVREEEPQIETADPAKLK